MQKVQILGEEARLDVKRKVSVEVDRRLEEEGIEEHLDRRDLTRFGNRGSGRRWEEELYRTERGTAGEK